MTHTHLSFHTGTRIRQSHVRGRGFTIVETLVAITVLMIALAGPLVVASRGLTGALASKDNMIASYLAQESMEMVKNRRDNNIAQYGDAQNNWLLGFNYTGDTTGACVAARPCDINGIDSITVGGSDYIPNVTTCNEVTGCVIYYSATSGYNHTSGSDTGFTRRMYFEDRIVNNGVAEKTVHVFVNWYEGTVSYEVHLTSQLTASSR